MSRYQHQIDFISRTQDILRKYELNSEYEKTLFINCCIGLLVAPQQWADRDQNIVLNGAVDYNNWGIDVNEIRENIPKINTDEHSIENIAYHIRNSICHFHFDLKDCNNNETIIKRINIIDKKKKNGKEVTSFDLVLDFEDFRKFILKYTEVLKEKLLQY